MGISSYGRPESVYPNDPPNSAFLPMLPEVLDTRLTMADTKHPHTQHH